MMTIKLTVGERLALAVFLAECDSASSMTEEGERISDFQQRVAANLRTRLSQLQDDTSFDRLLAAVKANPDSHSALLERKGSQHLIDIHVQRGIEKSLADGSLEITFGDARLGDYCLVPDPKFAIAIAFANIGQPKGSSRGILDAGRAAYAAIASDRSGETLKTAIAVIESTRPGASELNTKDLIVLMEKLIHSQAISAPDIGPMLGTGELIFRKFTQ